MAVNQRSIASKSSVPVVDFFNTGCEELKMELIAGESGLKHRKILEAAINRPGLGLTGFYDHFSWKRIQIIGLAEFTYLSSLVKQERGKRLDEFFSKKIPCVIVSRNQKIFPELKTLGDEYGVPVFRTAMITKHFINAATILMENLTAPRVNVQGTMVEIMGIGVMIEGRPGIGKSETALKLIRKGAVLISDDMTAIRVDSTGSIIGSAVSVTRYHMEIKGIGIIHVPSLFGVASVRNEKKLELLVTLTRPEDVCDEDLTMDYTKRTRRILDVDVPQVIIRVIPGRDLANVVEVAALDYKLRSLGHDAAKELDVKLMSKLTEGKDASE